MLCRQPGFAQYGPEHPSLCMLAATIRCSNDMTITHACQALLASSDCRLGRNHPFDIQNSILVEQYQQKH